jgi:hypothetical protein
MRSNKAAHRASDIHQIEHQIEHLSFKDDMVIMHCLQKNIINIHKWVNIIIFICR